MDKLQDMFNKQRELNDLTFETQSIPLKMSQLMEVGAAPMDLGPNTMVNEWLKKYLWALKDEARELDEELLDKWWSKDKLNMQNIRVEIIDMMHFLMSLAMTSGMDANEFYDLFLQKYQVNKDRQDNGYNAADKTEDDNENLVVNFADKKVDSPNDADGYKLFCKEAGKVSYCMWSQQPEFIRQMWIEKAAKLNGEIQAIKKAFI